MSGRRREGISVVDGLTERGGDFFLLLFFFFFLARGIHVAESVLVILRHQPAFFCEGGFYLELWNVR